MKFLVDAQLPPALARSLTAKGHAAEHVGDIGLQASSDAAIWDYALREGAAIVTKDEDFARSCPLPWCKSLRLHYALRRFGRVCQTAIAGRLTVG